MRYSYYRKEGREGGREGGRDGGEKKGRGNIIHVKREISKRLQRQLVLLHLMLSVFTSKKVPRLTSDCNKSAWPDLKCGNHINSLDVSPTEVPLSKSTFLSS